MYFSLHSEEIRLVDILPGQWSDDICCTLHQAAFANNLNYKALSYVWGAPNGARRLISVNGNPHSVTMNLQSALRRIRQRSESVTFWIDALSINQADNEERSIQVGMMREIYVKASEVVIYLGEAPNQDFAGCPSGKMSSTAVPSVFHGDIGDKAKIESFQQHCISKQTRKGSTSRRKLNYAHEVCCFLSLLSQSSKLEDIPPFDTASQDLLHSFYQRNVFEALRYLMRSSWWNRIWVVQEVVVPKNITLLYDSTTAPWEMLVKAAQAYIRNVLSTAVTSFPREYSDVLAFFSRIVLDIYHMRCRWETGEKTALLPLLRQFSNRKASDDRDKVYALLGLVQDQPEAASPIVKADYSLDTVAVFKNTALDIIDSSGSLGVLTGDLGRKNRQDLPSWAVDWSATYDVLDRRRADDTENYNASTGFFVYVKRKHGGDEGSSGVSRYLDRRRLELEQKGDTIGTNLDMYSKYSKILGTLEWRDYSMNPGVPLYDTECLEAIENYLAIKDGPVWLQDHGEVLECPSEFKGTVVELGLPCFSNDDLQSLVQSWGALLANFFEQRDHLEEGRMEPSQAFLRTVCADLFTDVGGTKQHRASHNDLQQIAAWIIESGDLGSINKSFGKSLASVAMLNSRKSPEQSANMHASIRAATFRRRLFITDTGYIGLGPSRLQFGDALYILVGGRAPFILRQAGHRDLPLNARRPRLGSLSRTVSELIGDCYVNDLMDGEGMKTWRIRATLSLQLSKVQLESSLYELRNWQTARRELTEAQDTLAMVRADKSKLWQDEMRRLDFEEDESQESKPSQELSFLHRVKEIDKKIGSKTYDKFTDDIDKKIRVWLDRKNLSLLKQADTKERIKKIEGITTELERQLEDTRIRLEDEIEKAHKNELDIKQQSYVYLI